MSSGAKERLEGIASGFMQARILLSAVELNLFTILGGKGMSAREAAVRAGAKPGPLERLLNALAGMKVLTKKNGIFRNSPASLRHLTDDAPEPLKDIMLHRNHMWETWSPLSRVVRTGRVPTRKRTAAQQKSFIRGMANIAEASARETARALARELKGAKRLLDVGGGPGVYACTFAARTPGLEALVLDLPGPLRIARETIQSKGMAGRVKCKAADVLEAAALGRGFDIVFMSNLIHSFERPAAKAVVGKAAKAVKPGGRLIIKEFYIRTDGTMPPFASLFSINMLVAGAGDCFTRAELKAWMAEGSVREERYIPVATASGILVGRKAGSGEVA